MSVWNLKLRQPFALILLGVVMLFGLLPIAAVLLLSFHEQQIPRFPVAGYSAQWYSAALGDHELRDAFANSVWVACTASILGTVLGCLTGRALCRVSWVPKMLLMAFVCIPFLIPVQVTAIALSAYFERLGLERGFYAVVVGHTCYILPLCVVVFRLGYEHVDATTEFAAINLGATKTETFLDITLPQLAPSIVASMLLAFLVSWDEFVISWYVGGYSKTLPAVVFGRLGGLLEPSIFATGMISFVVSVLIFFCVFLTMRCAQR